MNGNKASLLRSLGLGLLVIVAIVVYAFGFEVTQIDFAETRKPSRQEQITRILRALAKPDILKYERTEVQVSASLQMPCPEAGVPAPIPPSSGPYIVVTPACAAPRERVTIEGFNFEPDSTGPVNFIPPSAVNLKLGEFRADANGHFILEEALLPNRPNEQAQTIMAITRQNVGWPTFSQNAIDTWNKIIETIFLALLATTIGTLFSIPLSFFAAHNLMRPITSPLTSVALSLIVFPLGMVLGGVVATWVGSLSEMLTANAFLSLGGIVGSPLAVWGITRWALPPEETSVPSTGLRAARTIALLAATALFILFLFVLSSVMLDIGNQMREALGSLGFLGTFVAGLGDILGMLIVAVTAITVGGVLVSGASAVGQLMVEKLSPAICKAANLVLAALAGATLFAIIGSGIGWIYEITNPMTTIGWPAAVGGGLGLLIAIRLRHNDSLPIGYAIYYVTRTILNALRSIESLVMVLVFVAWVGIGPFPGTIALALHTVASLAKLYSEQVENISSGPLEAITATGANRLQTIIYAVIPQIIPPYISFTMYRWDINVRMSTILGFAGGGGIGFLLIQNINLLNYRAASTQIIAIAIVVATMDYLSTKLREKVI